MQSQADTVRLHGHGPFLAEQVGDALRGEPVVAGSQRHVELDEITAGGQVVGPWLRLADGGEREMRAGERGAALQRFRADARQRVCGGAVQDAVDVESALHGDVVAPSVVRYAQRHLFSGGEQEGFLRSDRGATAICAVDDDADGRACDGQDDVAEGGEAQSAAGRLDRRRAGRVADQRVRQMERLRIGRAGSGHAHRGRMPAVVLEHREHARIIHTDSVDAMPWG